MTRALLTALPLFVLACDNGPTVGSDVPNLQTIDQNGESVELYDFAGQVILLDVFAAWCGPCQELAPHNEALYQEFKDEGLVVIGSMTSGMEAPATLADLEDWAETYGITHPLLADPDGVLDYLAPEGYPTILLLDREMKVVIEDTYYMSDAAVRAAIRDLL